MFPPLLFAAAAYVVLIACASAPNHGPSELPTSYAQYRPPAVCGDSTVARRSPRPLNYEHVRRSAAMARPDLFPRDGPTRIAFLWYFVQEDGRVAEARLWKSSGSPVVDDVAVQMGRDMQWQPAMCGSEPVALWYGHPIALGGTS